MRRVKFSGVEFQTLMARLRWIWAAISLVWMMTFPLLLLQNRQMSAELLVRPAMWQPVVDQMARVTIMFGCFFGLSLAITLFAWHAWLLGKPKLRGNDTQ